MSHEVQDSELVYALDDAHGAQPRLTADDVVTCFECMLGRTPDQGGVDYHLSLGLADRAALGRYVMSTDEFAAYQHDVPYELGDFIDEWKLRVVKAAVRKRRLRSLGSQARGVLVQADSGRYIVDPEDGSVSLRLLEQGTYAPDELARALSVLPRDGNMLVVGTHIGALAIPLSRACARLDAIEANPRTQNLFSMNSRINDCGNIEFHPIAASNRTETIEFLLSRDNSGGAKRRPLSGEHYYYDAPETVSVEAKALDDVLPGRAYDLIIMDIEGSEYFALQGMQGILSRSAALAIEFLPHHLENVAGVTVDRFVDQLEAHFTWLFVPSRNELVPGRDMRATLQAMYDRGEGDDGLYFLKELPPAFLAANGLAVPA